MEHKEKCGSLEVVCGPMFAGKSEEIIRRVKRLNYAKKKVVSFKPQIDNRYSTNKIVSHNKNEIDATSVSDPLDILKYVDESVDAVVIDEAQFFAASLLDVVNHLVDSGKRVIIGGLDLDFRGLPFGPMPFLLSLAESVTKLTAICVVSGEAATRTQRLINGKPAHYNDPLVLIGASESYEPRARAYHEVVGKPKLEIEKIK